MAKAVYSGPDPWGVGFLDHDLMYFLILHHHDPPPPLFPARDYYGRILICRPSNGLVDLQNEDTFNQYSCREAVFSRNIRCSAIYTPLAIPRAML